MSHYVLSFKPTLDLFGTHDPSAALFKDEKLLYAIEEERLSRDKHAVETFPQQAIQSCLNYAEIELSDVSKVVVPYDPSLRTKQIGYELKRRLTSSKPFLSKIRWLERFVETELQARIAPRFNIEEELSQLGSTVPEIEFRSHHACHAASAFHPSGFDEALVFTIDGKGEYDSTVIWHGDSNGLRRLETFEFPNSLGHFFGIVTEYLGYHAFNGEGKVMGLAPYGSVKPEIEDALREIADFGADYDVTKLTKQGIDEGISKLADTLGRPPNEEAGEFDEWQQDLAFTVQSLLEETVTSLVAEYVQKTGISNVAMAGGVALNCKMNKRVLEMDEVNNVFIQPVAHDGGLAIGGGFIDSLPEEVPRMTNVYWGPEYTDKQIIDVLDSRKIEYTVHDGIETEIARRLSDGELVGWFQGRLEMGPRALGNRSILADPRTSESRDRVNEYVKHRESWRPFAPSILEEAGNEYLVKAEESPYMIKTFDVKPNKQDEIEAILHPADGTTRPQTVNKEQNPKYHRLISEFADITGVPVVLNTSFNDHGEPIVQSPIDALKGFYGMGLDTLVMGNVLVEK